jgi:serine phosphatase RsbU (regulator of sigma subunit)/anti-sigma regulatory factor (Ser/Thr protein kinase)
METKMNEKKRPFWKRLFGLGKSESAEETAIETPKTTKGEVHPLDIPQDDPLLEHINNSPGVIEVDKLNIESQTLQELRQQGVKLTLPLVSQGELIGLLNLGPRMSEQEYSSDDFRLLNNLATQASPALRVAQLAQQQLAEAQERERLEQELRVARVIQETLLPKEIPAIEGWQITAHWQPAQEVSGDFYDFVDLPDGRMAVIIADVTDKGVPAALVMATSRSILRAAAEHLVEPGEVLARANDLLHPDIPPKMFVTCLYMIIEPGSEKIVFANAGHNLPYVVSDGEVNELRATGMPLGLMPGMSYEEVQAFITPGQELLLSSDGLAEAHNEEGEMFGFDRIKAELASQPLQDGPIPVLLQAWKDFIDQAHEQEDDITLVKLRFNQTELENERGQDWSMIDEFKIPSQPGNERSASQQAIDSLTSIGIAEKKLQQFQTAVAEAIMNAMEHGNQYREDLPVHVQIFTQDNAVSIRVSDHGQGPVETSISQPDLDAKLAGEQSPRGWGLFLIENMVDEMNVLQNDQRHTIELIIHY